MKKPLPYEPPELMELGRAADVTLGTWGPAMEACDCSRPSDPDLPDGSEL